MNQEFAEIIRRLGAVSNTTRIAVMNLNDYVSGVNSNDPPMQTFNEIRDLTKDVEKTIGDNSDLLKKFMEKLDSMYNESTAKARAEQIALLDSKIAEAKMRLETLESARLCLETYGDANLELVVNSVINEEPIAAEAAEAAEAAGTVETVDDSVDYLYYSEVNGCYVQSPEHLADAKFACINCEIKNYFEEENRYYYISVRVLFVKDKLIIFPKKSYGGWSDNENFKTIFTGFRMPKDESQLLYENPSKQCAAKFTKRFEPALDFNQTIEKFSKCFLTHKLVCMTVVGENKDCKVHGEVVAHVSGASLLRVERISEDHVELLLTDYFDNKCESEIRFWYGKECAEKLLMRQNKSRNFEKTLRVDVEKFMHLVETHGCLKQDH